MPNISLRKNRLQKKYLPYKRLQAKCLLQRYFFIILLLPLIFVITSCRQAPGKTTGYEFVPTYPNEEAIEPFIREATTPAIEFMRWQFEEEATRDGYTLIPTHFADTGICVSSSFILTLPETAPDYTSEIAEEDAVEGATENAAELKPAPNITIDGQPNPITISEGENTFRITPAERLSHNNLYILRISHPDGSYTTWTFQTTARLQISAILPFNQSTNVPVNTGIEISFSLDNHTPIDDFFSIRPEVSGSFITRGTTSVFMPDDPLMFGEIYTVTIKAGIVVEGTYEAITDDLSFSFETESKADFEERQDTQPAHIGFSSVYAEFPSFDAPYLNFWFSYDQNKARPRIDVRVYQFPTASGAVEAVDRLINTPHWAIAAWEQNRVETSGLRHIDSFNITRAQEDTWMETMTLPGNLPPGFYLINATADERTSQAILQITDIAVQVISDDKQTIVWANDMNTGLPLDDAEVLIPFSGRSFRTDASGIAVISGNILHPDVLNRLVVRSDRGENVVILQGTTGIMPLSSTGRASGISGFDMWWGPQTSPDDEHWSVLHFDRTLFQRSDTLYFWGFTANRRTGAFPENVTVELTSGSWRWDFSGMDDTPLHRPYCQNSTVKSA